MPLRDHFRGELSDRRHWESFHSLWTAAITGRLNEKVLPENYFAEAQVKLSRRVEVDVATIHETPSTPVAETNGGVAVQTWAPPTVGLLIPATFPDDIELQIFHSQGGPNLVAAIELISPGNKDRPETRRAFAAKCAGYLQRGIGLVIIDVVTERQANLHDELIDLMRHPPRFAYPSDSLLYAVSYRPAHQEETNLLETWPFDLTLGEALPTIPLPLLRGPTLPLELEVSYTEALKRSRL